MTIPLINELRLESKFPAKERWATPISHWRDGRRAVPYFLRKQIEMGADGASPSIHNVGGSFQKRLIGAKRIRRASVASARLGAAEIVGIQAIHAKSQASIKSIPTTQNLNTPDIL